MDPFYQQLLYPFQDKILQAVCALDTGFYLSGGTAASRGYLHHRYSDDLDFFVNDREEFPLWTRRILNVVQEIADLTVLVRDDRFVRIVLRREDVALRVEFINDVPARVGSVQRHPVLGNLDSATNILANKITALIDRAEAKDYADIWGFCYGAGLSITEALGHAGSKAAGIFPPDLARALCEVTENHWQRVRWINAPALEEYLVQIQRLGDILLSG